MLDDPDLPREQEMRRVYQSGGEGCGIACVAMLAETTYAAAKRRVPHWEDRGTYSDELRKELEYYEIQTEPRKPIRRLNYAIFQVQCRVAWQTWRRVALGSLGRRQRQIARSL